MKSVWLITTEVTFDLVRLLQFFRKKRIDFALVWCDDVQTAGVLVEMLVGDDYLIVVDERINTGMMVREKTVFTLDDFMNEYQIRAEVFNHPIEQSAISNSKILFFADNDTHVHMFYPVSKYFKEVRFFVSKFKKENAAEALERLKVRYSFVEDLSLEAEKPSGIVFGNDWSYDAKKMIYKARKLGIPTVCVQEGILDFRDKQRRMQWADFPFIQGPLTQRLLPRNIYFITGNPRYDVLTKQALPLNHQVMINCNFTYGIFEDWRDKWVRDCVEACTRVGLSYFISQHPRDKGLFPGLNVEKSSPFVIHEHLAKSSIVISRFSTVVYEALLMGRYVIYYNPHGETMENLKQDPTGALIYATADQELEQGLKKLITSPPSLDNIERFITLHCGPRDGAAAARCGRALQEILTFAPFFKSSVFINRLLLDRLLLEGRRILRGAKRFIKASNLGS